MPKTITTSKRRTLEFIEQRLGPWADSAALLELSGEDVAALGQAAADARAALREAEAARERAVAATAAFAVAGARAERLVRGAIRRIRLTATTSDDPAAVYAAAQLDEPGRPGPKRETPVPNAPAGLHLTLDTQGRAVLRFTASREGGAVFEVQRRVIEIDGDGREREGPWEDAGIAMARRFADERTPRGAAAIAYRVRARRPGAASAFAAPVVLSMGVAREAA